MFSTLFNVIVYRVISAAAAVAAVIDVVAVAAVAAVINVDAAAGCVSRGEIMA